MAVSKPAWALGYLGGNGDGFAVGRYTTQDVMLIGSTTQTFAVGDSATAISTIEIIQDLAASGTGITTANDIRVKIPVALNMIFDNTDTTATITGGASAKVSTTVSYEDTNATLVIDVTSAFADADVIYVSGLSFKSFNTSGTGRLQLETDNAGSNNAVDDNYKYILLGSLTAAAFYGGNGDGFAAYSFQTQQDGVLFGNGF
ncbi:MAG: hypothetical protein HYZ86_03205 [Candidatus Omnitrophica bacterium]|nr:hypothetical protein [Candidatus Omnitrophota bacterium]